MLNPNGQSRMTGDKLVHHRDTTAPTLQKCWKVPKLILQTFRPGHFVPMWDVVAEYEADDVELQVILPM
jgi:hypothetical protein